MNTPTEKNISFTPAKIKITSEMTIPKVFRRIARENKKHIAIERKTSVNTWLPVTWQQFEHEYRSLARGFIGLGIQPGDRVALMCHTSYEFSLIDFALWSIGASAIAIYETDSAEQAQWIIEDSHCRFAVVENLGMEAIVTTAQKSCPFLEKIFVLDHEALNTIASISEEIKDDEIDARIDNLKADDVATIIYTSGTTGKPKGARITHRNLLSVAMNGPLDDDLFNLITGRDKRNLIFLPMAHVFARFTNIMALYAGNTVGYTADIKNLAADMQSFKPTYILAVPRVFEKIYNAADASTGKGVKHKLFRHYVNIAIQYSKALDTPEGPSRRLRIEHRLGSKLIFSKLHTIMGNNLQGVISGGAPLGERLGHFFRGIGITLLEGYGLTETSAPCCVNRLGNIKVGSVGLAYPGCHITSDEHGELLVKGDSVFDGYHNNDEATREAFTEDGWYKTGDIGTIDDNGYVWITGRKKELIVTAGGKNVAPAVLEDRLRGHPLISQVVVVGDQKPFIAALITLDEEMLPTWLTNHNLPPMSVHEASTNPQVIAAIDRGIARANEAVSRAESIRKFTILTNDFTVANGYLTASMKVKRGKVLKDFAHTIEEKLYTK
ncbi:MAG: long-chain fatty acid--CoA ligase [Actinomycetaceae bacterium]|nr:long-chain fatty acid--CoA ligase [Actinomycetaceae bacterium]